jgi:hypothetical protein
MSRLTCVAPAKTCASGKKTIELPLGEHVDVPCSFQVPWIGGQEMKMVLIAYKGGVKKFEEEKVFKVTGTGKTEKTSESVSFGKE